MVLVGAIDQGTSSSRFLVFSTEDGSVVASHQIQIQQKFPQDGWVEMDPMEILDTTRQCIRETGEKLVGLGRRGEEVAGVGVTNQRETTVAWDRETGKPLYPAIVWLDARTADLAEELAQRTPSRSKDAFRDKVGLPLSPYFSALKLHWLFHNVPAVKEALDSDRLMVGTVDTWLIWNLSGVYATDVTNASRTMLMNLETRAWDPEMCDFFQIPAKILPEIRSSAEVFGPLRGTGSVLDGRPLAGCLGDQQAALVGQGCLGKGEAKNTYGTGCFLLYNTGTEAVVSKRGLLTTVAFQMGREGRVHYALEGAVAVAGAAVRWLRDSLGLIASSAEVETLARSVSSTGGVCFVPAFSGLYAPHWDPTARASIQGLSFGSGRGEICRAALEAVCWQTREILDAMGEDSGAGLGRPLRVDGGMTRNELLLELQADCLGVAVEKAAQGEATALGAAVAAGVAVGAWTLEAFRALPAPLKQYSPTSSPQHRQKTYARWKEAVKRSKGWTNQTS